MLPKSIARGATDKARHTVLTALGAAAASLVGVMIGGIIYQSEHRAATERLIDAYRWADEILLADEQLAHSANMAATTGTQAWIDSYEANLPKIAAAIQRASELAPPAIRDSFDARPAYRTTVWSTWSAKPSTRAAPAICRVPAPFSTRRSISTTSRSCGMGRAHFLEHDRRRPRGLRDVQINAIVATSAAIPMFVVGGLILWRRLTASLAKSEGAYTEAEQQIKNLAMIDVLTGLSNRLALRESLRQAIRARGRRRRSSQC